VQRLSLIGLRRRHVELGRPLPSAMEAELRADPRPGARAILEAVDRRRRRNRADGQHLRFLLRHETDLWATGVSRIAGVDEAGMSPLAGPVAAAAVILPPGARIPGVDDSKKLDVGERDRLAPLIKQACTAWAVAFTEVEEIDHINIYWAGMLAMRRAVEKLGTIPDFLLIDGRALRDPPCPQRRIFGGDAKSLSIAAASILAKTARDARMKELDAQYPGYGFARHKGYPVKSHVAALERLGACEIHRRSFAPVRKVMGLPPLPPWETPPPADTAKPETA
jgi:ribonuclease HII